MKNVLKILIVIILLIALVFIGYKIYQGIFENRFKKMLEENDATNYKLIEIVNGEETTVYVRDKILLMEAGNTKTWVNDLEQKRVIFNEEYQTAIMDQNDESLQVPSLNHTYIQDFFENKNQTFQYLGKQDGFYQIQFTEKGSHKITLFYINVKTKVVEKMIQNAGNFELVTEFHVEKNCVSKEEVELPNLEGYRAYDSVNSR